MTLGFAIISFVTWAFSGPRFPLLMRSSLPQSLGGSSALAPPKDPQCRGLESLAIVGVPGWEAFVPLGTPLRCPPGRWEPQTPAEGMVKALDLGLSRGLGGHCSQ